MDNQRLNAILTASREQLKGLDIRVEELDQILELCDSQFSQAFYEQDQHLTKIEKFLVSNICNPCWRSWEALMKKRGPLMDATSRMQMETQFARLDGCKARFDRIAQGDDLDEDGVAELAQFLQECNNTSKSLCDETEELGALIKDLNI